MTTHSSALLSHGSYRRLHSFQATEIIYDATVPPAAVLSTNVREPMTRDGAGGA